MGQHLAKLVLLTTPLGGCSLLYDPDRLAPAADAARPPPDIFPCQMEVTDLAPATLFEGTGVGGSRPAVLVIMGRNLTKQNTMVSVMAPGAPRMPMFEIDNANLEVDSYGEFLAVPVTLPIDSDLKRGEFFALDVTVTQECMEGPRSSMVTGKLTLVGLDELIPPVPDLVAGVSDYSQIAIPSGMIKIASSAMEPVILRSRSSVAIMPAISADAGEPDVQSPGPGGGRGGNGGPADLLNPGPGMAGLGPSPGLPSGGAAGFSNADVPLATLGAPNRGSGGAGGNGGTTQRGGDGGGGGGTIEITAAGDLTVTEVSAAGENGTGGANPGGGGSGGVILLRAGGNLTSGAINVAGGGAGAPGRARYDAGGMATGAITGHHRGPMFVNLPLNPPLIARSRTPEITVSGKPLSLFRYFIIRKSGTSALVDETIGAGGTARVTLQQDLGPGLNQLCLVVGTGDASSDTRNCIDIAYLPEL